MKREFAGTEVLYWETDEELSQAVCALINNHKSPMPFLFNVAVLGSAIKFNEVTEEFEQPRDVGRLDLTSFQFNEHGSPIFTGNAQAIQTQSSYGFWRPGRAGVEIQFPFHGITIDRFRRSIDVTGYNRNNEPHITGDNSDTYALAIMRLARLLPMPSATEKFETASPS